MANVYIVARPKGQLEGTVVVDYAIEDQTERLLGRCRTQEEASSGQGAEATLHSFHCFANSAIKTIPIIGDRLRVRVGFESSEAPAPFRRSLFAPDHGHSAPVSIQAATIAPNSS
jgi:hypothetical protein